MLRIPEIFHRAVLRAARHDCLNLAQSAAYSAMFALFPALIVAAAVIAFLPDSAPLRGQFGAFFQRILPSDVLPLLTGYFATSPHNAQSARAIALAGIISLTGASSVMATLMEGLRRAGDLPDECWTFLQRRARAFLLVPLSLVPLIFASILVVFGHWITMGIAARVMSEVQPVFFVVAFMLRWIIALAGVVGVTATIYHLGTPAKQQWYRTVPGAIAATVMWFVTTLGFGWYVTRFANYTVIYGSLGTGIALLIWLYIIFLSVLCGAEFNREFEMMRTAPMGEVNLVSK